MNDTELLRRYAEEGSEEAFAELVRLRLGLVYSAALRQSEGDAHRAQDVAQTVFSELARHAVSLCRHRALIGWLYTSTRYTAAKLARSERRRRIREQEAYTMREDQASLTMEIPAGRLRPLLDDAMHQLSETDRRALLLRFFDGCSMAELGGYLGLSESTARKRVERALGKLKTHLAQRGLSSTAAAVGIALSQEAAAATAPAGLAATISGSALTAAATAAPAIGLISFMTAQKSAAPIGLAALLGLLSIGVGVHQWQKSTAARAALAAATQRFEAGQQQLQALLRNSEAAEKSLLTLQQEVGQRGSAAAVPRPPAAAPANPAAGTVNGKADWDRFAAAYPEARGIMIEKYRDQLRLNNRLFFLQAGLSPAQIEELLTHAANFLVENRLGITANMDLPVEAGLVQFANREDLLRTVMSDSAVQQARELLRMGALGSWLNDARSSTIFAGEPLSSNQELQLAQVIANNSPAYRNGGNWNRNSMDWAKAYVQAQTVLSPAQWRAAEGSFLMLEYRQALDQARQNQGAIVPVGPIEK